MGVYQLMNFGLGQLTGSPTCSGPQRTSLECSRRINLNEPIVDTVSFSGRRDSGTPEEAPPSRRSELLSSAGSKALWGLGCYLPAMALSAYATPAITAAGGLAAAGTLPVIAGLASGGLAIAGIGLLGWAAVNAIRGLSTKSDEPASTA